MFARYSILGFGPEHEPFSQLTLSAIKKAYYQKALLFHPDKNPDDSKEAHRQFQGIQEAYAILSDSEKRALYDQLGDDGYDGSKHSDGLGFEDVTLEEIERFQQRYQGSKEEETDLLCLFTRFKGSFAKIMDSLLFSSALEEDVARYRSIIDKALETEGIRDVDYASNYPWSEKSVKARRRKEARELKEFELTKEKGLNEEQSMGKGRKKRKASRGGKENTSDQDDDLASLALLIKSRSSSKFDSMIQGLEEKYLPSTSKKTKKK